MVISYTNYKKISYILSENPGLSGQIAYEFLDKIINFNDVLKFTFYGHGKHNESFDLLMQMYDNVSIQPSKNNEKVIIIKDFVVNDKLKEILCELGMFPNFLKISKIDSNLEEDKKDFFWTIEFSDEILIFTHIKNFIDDSKIILVEQTLLNKGVFYERKEIKDI